MILYVRTLIIDIVTTDLVGVWKCGGSH